MGDLPREYIKLSDVPSNVNRFVYRGALCERTTGNKYTIISGENFVYINKDGIVKVASHHTSFSRKFRDITFSLEDIEKTNSSLKERVDQLEANTLQSPDNINDRIDQELVTVNESISQTSATINDRIDQELVTVNESIGDVEQDITDLTNISLKSDLGTHTDNSLVRFNGSGNDAKDSVAILDDAGNMSGLLSVGKTQAKVEFDEENGEVIFNGGSYKIGQTTNDANQDVYFAGSVSGSSPLSIISLSHLYIVGDAIGGTPDPAKIYIKLGGSGDGLANLDTTVDQIVITEAHNGRNYSIAEFSCVPVLPNFSNSAKNSFSGTPLDGSIFFNTDDNSLEFFDGANWQQISAEQDVTVDLTPIENLLGGYITPLQFGATGDGIEDDTLSITSALLDPNGVIFIDRLYLVTFSITFPEDKTLVFGSSGAIVLLDDTITLTINCRIVANDYQHIFRGAIKRGSYISPGEETYDFTVVGSPIIPYCTPQWFGAVSGDSTEEIKEINLYAFSSAIYFGACYVPPGEYHMNYGLNFRKSNMHFWGAGSKSKIITSLESGQALGINGTTSTSDLQNIYIHDLAIDTQNTANMNGLGMSGGMNGDTTTVTNCIYRNIWLTNIGRNAVTLQFNCYRNLIENIFIDNCCQEDNTNVRAIISLEGTANDNPSVEGNIVRKIWCKETRDNVISLDKTRNNTVSNVYVLQAGQDTVSNETQYGGCVIRLRDSNENNIIKDVYVKECRSGFVIDPESVHNIIENIEVNIDASNTTDNGIVIRNYGSYNSMKNLYFVATDNVNTTSAEIDIRGDGNIISNLKYYSGVTSGFHPGVRMIYVDGNRNEIHDSYFDFIERVCDEYIYLGASGTSENCLIAGCNFALRETNVSRIMKINGKYTTMKDCTFDNISSTGAVQAYVLSGFHLSLENLKVNITGNIGSGLFYITGCFGCRLMNIIAESIGTLVNFVNILNTSSNAAVSGCRFMSSTPAAALIGIYVQASDCQITNNRVMGINESAIYVGEFCYNTIISGNIIKGTTTYALRCRGSNITFSGNTISSGGYLYFENGQYNTITGNIFDTSTISSFNTDTQMFSIVFTNNMNLTREGTDILLSKLGTFYTWEDSGNIYVSTTYPTTKTDGSVITVT